jgi:hypothetical protein
LVTFPLFSKCDTNFDRSKQTVSAVIIQNPADEICPPPQKKNRVLFCWLPCKFPRKLNFLDEKLFMKIEIFKVDNIIKNTAGIRTMAKGVKISTSQYQ